MELDRVTAIVVNWRTPDYTVRAVQALVGDGLPPERVVVVDNGSGDGSAERLREELPGTLVVAQEENAGFARANNQGARRLPGDAYLLVNSDAFLHRTGSVQALLDGLDDSSVGLVAARLLNEDGTLQSSVAPLPSPAVAAVQATGLSRFLPDGWQPRWSTHWSHAEEREIEAAIAAVLLVRGATWDELGGFDESAFMYAEDRDLCWRARLAGWRVWFTPRAEFVHVGSGTATTTWTAAGRAERVGAAEAAMVRRHRGRTSAALTIGVWRAGLLARWLYSRVTGADERAAAFRAWPRGLSRRAGS
jgi:N-acetylglucosaminyl-diphospho-decaprenol L-rhamnosyltransferase